MKIFEDGTSSWWSKVNFVDSNDVFVGYDLSQCCCEEAGYFITDKITPYSWGEAPETDYDVEGYNFDKGYFEYVPSGDLDCGEMIAFRLVSEGEPDLYLHLYNAHNGYYSHGFEVKVGDVQLQGGYL